MLANTSCDIVQINVSDSEIITYLINYKIYRNRKNFIMCSRLIVKSPPSYMPTAQRRCLPVEVKVKVTFILPGYDIKSLSLGLKI